MMLDDLLKDFGGAGVIPHLVGIDDGDGAVFTDAQAIGFGAEDAAVLAEAELLEAGFKIVPGGKPRFFGTTFGLGLIAAEKDMPLDLIDP